MAKAKTYKGKSLVTGGGGKFAKLRDAIMGEGKSKESADKIAASVGRKKSGAKKMEQMAAAGRKKMK